MDNPSVNIAVVVPCYGVGNAVLELLSRIPGQVRFDVREAHGGPLQPRLIGDNSR